MLLYLSFIRTREIVKITVLFKSSIIDRYKSQKMPRSLLTVFFVIVLNFSTQVLSKNIHKEHSLYRNILVTQKDGRRCMRFTLRHDREQNQSCYLLKQPRKLVFDYTKLSMLGAMARPDAKHILIIGLGGGTLVKAYHFLLPDAQITSVEIDPAVVKVAKKYFHLPEEPWHTIVAKDARIFVKRQLLKQTSYDLIILDAFNGDYIPEHLMTREFFTEIKQLLNNKGIALANTFATSKLYHSESATYANVFGDFIELKGHYSGNRIIAVVKNGKFLIKQIQQYLQQYSKQLTILGIDQNYLLQSLNAEPKWNKSAPVLTDDFSPVNILNH